METQTIEAFYEQHHPDQYPHRDQAVLHAPGECGYCDLHPDWQALRIGWGIAFTGHAPGEVGQLWHDGQQPCPSDARRGQGQAHTWYGNRPTNVPDDQLPTETFESRVMYPRLFPQYWPMTDEEAERLRERFTVAQHHAVLPMVMPPRGYEAQLRTGQWGTAERPSLRAFLAAWWRAIRP